MLLLSLITIDGGRGYFWWDNRPSWESTKGYHYWFAALNWIHGERSHERKKIEEIHHYVGHDLVFWDRENVDNIVVCCLNECCLDVLVVVNGLSFSFEEEWEEGDQLNEGEWRADMCFNLLIISIVLNNYLSGYEMKKHWYSKFKYILHFRVNFAISFAL